MVDWRSGLLLFTVPLAPSGSSEPKKGRSHGGGNQHGKVSRPGVLMGEGQQSAHALPPFLSLAHSSAPFLTHPAKHMLGSVPSMVPLPSALGYLSNFRTPLTVEGGECKLCRRYFPTARDYQAHVRICRKGMLSCDFCDMAFARRFNLKVHMRCRHGVGEQLTCSSCGITFRSKVRLETHRCSARERRDRPDSWTYFVILAVVTLLNRIWV